MDKKQVRVFFLIFVLAFFISKAYINLNNIKEPFKEIQYSIDLEKLSKMDISGESLLKIKKFCDNKNLDFPTYLSKYMLKNDYSVGDIDNEIKKIKSNSYNNYILRHLYYMIFADIAYFPIKLIEENDIDRYTYMDTFLADRTYGGDRKHMGIDIMDKNNEKGYFPIVSMTDGIVENIGWLELGGYRVGIRSKSGAYFYYAHLDSYAKGLEEGLKVKAGQLLGYMGNTGYGEEGTIDKFDVHLHIGISLNIDEIDEFWINPFSILEMYDYKKIEK